MASEAVLAWVFWQSGAEKVGLELRTVSDCDDSVAHAVARR